MHPPPSAGITVSTDAMFDIQVSARTLFLMPGVVCVAVEGVAFDPSGLASLVLVPPGLYSGPPWSCEGRKVEVVAMDGLMRRKGQAPIQSCIQARTR